MCRLWLATCSWGCFIVWVVTARLDHSPSLWTQFFLPAEQEGRGEGEGEKEEREMEKGEREREREKERERERERKREGGGEQDWVDNLWSCPFSLRD